MACLPLFAYQLLVSRQIGTPASPRSQCRNNLKQIGLALHDYHKDHGHFPPQFVVDSNGRRLYSWRVLILPYLHQEPLFRQFDLDEPWDSPHNRPLSDQALAMMQCPDRDQDTSLTSYLAVAGEGTAWRGEKTVSFSDLGQTQSVILVVEVADATIPWAKPQDLKLEAVVRGINSSRTVSASSPHRDRDGTTGANVLFADGHTEYLKASTDDERLRKELLIPGR